MSKRYKKSAKPSKQEDPTEQVEESEVTAVTIAEPDKDESSEKVEESTKKIDLRKFSSPRTERSTVTSNGRYPPGLPLHKETTLTMRASPRLFLPNDVASLLFGWMYSRHIEMSCFGSVQKLGANDFVITAVYLPKQQGSGTSTEVDGADIFEMMRSLREENGWNVNEEPPLRLWAHSHPKMGVGWSTSDEINCKELVADWFISLCVGDNFLIRCRIDFNIPFQGVIDNVPVYCLPFLPEFKTQLQEEVKDKIKTPPKLVSPSKTVVTAYPRNKWLLPGSDADSDDWEDLELIDLRDTMEEEVGFPPAPAKELSLSNSRMRELLKVWEACDSDEILQYLVLIQEFTDDPDLSVACDTWIATLIQSDQDDNSTELVCKKVKAFLEEREGVD